MNPHAEAFAAEPMPTLPYRSECFAEDVCDEATAPQAAASPSALATLSAPRQDPVRWPAAMLVAAPLGAALLGALTPALLG